MDSGRGRGAGGGGQSEYLSGRGSPNNAARDLYPTPPRRRPPLNLGLHRRWEKMGEFRSGTRILNNDNCGRADGGCVHYALGTPHSLVFTILVLLRYAVGGTASFCRSIPNLRTAF